MVAPFAHSHQPQHLLKDVEESSIDKSDILGLCHGNILALRIRAFAPLAATQRAQERIHSHEARGALGHATQFTRLGMAYSEVRSDHLRRLYHESALANIRRIRDIFSELASPMDRLRNMLDEIWPKGAHLLNIGNDKCFVGICRYLQPGIDLEPHIDNLHWTLPNHVDWKLQYQLSANVYLEVPPTGGELELWNFQPDPETYGKLQGSRSYGISREALPLPNLTIRPAVGDLIIMNPRFIHAVRPTLEFDRITMSAFIGIRSLDDSLNYWS